MNALLTLLPPMIALCIVAATIRRYGHRMTEGSIFAVACVPLCATFLMSLYFGSEWNRSYWLGDVRTGDVFSMDMPTQARQDILQQRARGMNVPVELTVAGLAVPECTQVLYPGKSMAFDPASGSFSLSVVGRASHLDYRYLLRSTGKPGSRAVQALGPGCVSLFFITSDSLIVLKQDLKQLRDIAAEISEESPVLGELLSVQPLTGRR